MEYHLRVNTIRFAGNNMTLGMDGYIRSDEYGDYVPRGRVVLVFDNGIENRRLPLVINKESASNGKFTFSGGFLYRLNNVFWRSVDDTKKVTLKFQIYYGTEFEECAEIDVSKAVIEKINPYYEYKPGEREIELTYNPPKLIRLPKPVTAVLTAIRNICVCAIGLVLIPWFVVEVLFSLFGAGKLANRVTSKNYLHRIVGQITARFQDVTRINVTMRWFKINLMAVVFGVSKLHSVKKNKIAFVSTRNKELSPNFSLVRDELERRGGYEFDYYTFTKAVDDMKFGEIIKLSRAIATSKVVLLEEYTPAVNNITMKKGSLLIQLWHAAGAFKTGGYARLGKPGATRQEATTHRNYDYVTVSSTYCKYCHALGFGVSDYSVVPTGVARTDVFFDQDYKHEKRVEFFTKFPAFAGKKIIMFAPTFRGDNKDNAYYDFERFNAGEVLDQLGDEYALIIKHHPFVAEKHPVPEGYSDRIIDLTEGHDINDLLFITDIVISDYSSLIYEASLLNIPMLFYTFDYEQYVRERDFYFDLKLLSPGKLVYSQDELVESIKNEDFQMGNMERFKDLFFDDLDGRSTERIVDLIEDSIKGSH